MPRDYQLQTDHEYFGLSLPIIWDIVTNKLDELEVACQEILENLG